MLPFDTQVCHKCQICLRFHRILKVILEMAFSAHRTQIWKSNWISMTIISKVAWKCIWCCRQVQRCVTGPPGVKLCSGVGSHIGMFSLWISPKLIFREENIWKKQPTCSLAQHYFSKKLNLKKYCTVIYKLNFSAIFKDHHKLKMFYSMSENVFNQCYKSLWL